MNIVEVQEQLKDFSKNQLVQEMQRPSGVAPQFLVLSEINRRARMEQDYQARMAQDMPSVAQEAIAAAGVPQQGIAQMASAMNPKSQDGIGSFMKQSVPMNTGGVTKAQAGTPLGLRQNNPGNLRPGAGFIGETGDRGGYAVFENPDYGLRAMIRNLMTYQNQYGIDNVDDLVDRYAPAGDNSPEARRAYKKNLINALNLSGAKDKFNISENLDKLVPAIVTQEQGQMPFTGGVIGKAIQAAGTEDEKEVAKILGPALPASRPSSGIEEFSTLQPGLTDTLIALMGSGQKMPGVDVAGGGSDFLLGLKEGKYNIPGFKQGPDLSEVQTKSTQDGVEKSKDNVGKFLKFLFPRMGKQVQPGLGEGQETTAPKQKDSEIMTGPEEFSTLQPGLTAAGQALSGQDSLASMLSFSKAIPTTQELIAKRLEGLDVRRDDLEKQRYQDRMLALADFGLRLASSQNPRLLGAAGEAGIGALKGLQTSRALSEAAAKGITGEETDLIKSLATLEAATGKSSKSLKSSDALKAYTDIQDILSDPLKSAQLSPEKLNELESTAAMLYRLAFSPRGTGIVDARQLNKPVL